MSDRPGTVIIGSRPDRAPLKAEQQHLSTFAGGMFGLGSQLLQDPDQMSLAVELTDSAIWAYQSTATGLMPEIVTFYHPQDSQRWEYATVDNEDMARQRGIPVGSASQGDVEYMGRPETIESVFYMYRITGDPAWQDQGGISSQNGKFLTIFTYSVGFANIANVNNNPAKQIDIQESFVLAETLKYYYLLFSEPDLINLNDYVFNTEAHPLLRPGRSKRLLWKGVEFGTPAQFLRLPHPRTGTPSLFLPARKNATTANEGNVQADIILEVQAVNATGDKQRSWFVNGDTVIADGKLLLLTPFDPVFLLVRILLVVGTQHTGDGSNRRSLPYDDIFEAAGEHFQSSSRAEASTSKAGVGSKRVHQGYEEDDEAENALAKMVGEDISRFGRLAFVQRAMESICDCQEITPDMSTYRLNDDKLLDVLKMKIARLATRDAFEGSPTLTRMLAKEGVGDGQGLPEKVQLEARQKASLDLIAGYLPKDIFTLLKGTYEFPSLTQYLTDTSTSSVLSVDYMPGLGSTISFGPSTFGMSKGSKSEANGGGGKGGFGKPPPLKKQKSSESNGVRQLKKASTRGMSPLTSFFSKKPPAPKAEDAPGEAEPATAQS
ncbi:hypothetical protein EMMF5_000220 [Cystobasidiomycetes sp. EMM_F5]